MIFRHDRTLFARAAEVATGSSRMRVRVGAVVCKGHRTIASAHNVPGDTPKLPHYLGHAERRVLASARNNSTLYVARLGAYGGLMPSRPCAECWVSIELNGKVKQVVYWDGTDLIKEKV